MKVIINSDGVAEPTNPGIVTYGFVVRNDIGDVLKKGKGVIGESKTNNIAENTAAIEALEWIMDNLNPPKIVLRGDSQLVIRQISGRYAVKSSNLRPLYEKLKKTIADSTASFEAEWVPREQNERADALSKKAIKEYVKTHDYRFNGYPLVKCDECGAVDGR